VIILEEGSMRAVRTVALAAAVAAAPALAQETYVIDGDHTVPTFEISHMGGLSTQRGIFYKTTGKVVLDRAARSGSVEAVIDTATVSTGSASRDRILRGEDYFDTAKYPTATFKATKLDFDGENLVGAEGELTMRGVTKPVAVKVSNFRCLAPQGNRKPVCGGEVSTVVKPSDFGMRKTGGHADEVRIAIPVEAVGAGS
jgi:polyisoprenoid-binding protein YceI